MSAIICNYSKEGKQEINHVPSKNITIDDLPKDLIIKIFDYLSLQALGSCAQVCKKWKTTLGSYGDKLFLKFFTGKTFNDNLQNHLVGQKTLTEKIKLLHTEINKLQQEADSVKKKKLFLKIAIVVGLILLVTAAVAITVLTCGIRPAVAAAACGIFFICLGAFGTKKLLS